MRFNVTSTTVLPDGYRSNRVRSMFNVDAATAGSHTFSIDAPIEDRDWRVGLVVGPSGSGKTTLGQRILGAGAYFRGHDWPHDGPIIDAMGSDAGFDDVTGALSQVGLGTVPSWLRPYRVLSGGERFRADLARILLDHPGDVVIDEFTSVVDRQIAQVGAAAFVKGWRRRPAGRAVLLSCHYDIVDWVQPDWIIDTRDWSFHWRSVQRPPRIDVDIYETNWSEWPLFEPHHYLKLPRMVAATNYVGWVGGVPVAHVAVGTMAGLLNARACRLVVMPEWQGAGIGMRFLNAVCERWRTGENRYGIKVPTIIHTSHPGLIAALRRAPGWSLSSRQVTGVNKGKSAATMAKSGKGANTGYGGHTRAVLGFRYTGVP